VIWGNICTLCHLFIGCKNCYDDEALLLTMKFLLCRKYFQLNSHLEMENQHTEILVISMAQAMLLHPMDGGHQCVCFECFGGCFWVTIYVKFVDFFNILHNFVHFHFFSALLNCGQFTYDSAPHCGAGIMFLQLNACTLVQSAVLRSHVIRPSVCLCRWWIVIT